MTPPTPEQDWPARGLIVAGIGSIVALLLGIALWGVRAEVADATALPGIIATANPPVNVGHTTGGKVVAVYVTPGALVAAGDPLVQLDDASLLAEAARLSAAMTEAKGETALAEAALSGIDEVALPQDMPAAVAIRYRSLFAERHRLAAQTRLQLLAERDRFLRRQTSVTDQSSAISRQRAFVATELAAQSTLLDRGLIQTSRVTALQSEVARLDAQLAALAGEEQAAKDGAAEIEVALAAQSAARRETAASQLQNLSARIADLTLRRDEVTRLIEDQTLRAPVSGRIHAVRLPSAGELLRPSETLLTILPEMASQIVRFRIPPDALPLINTGQTLSLRVPDTFRHGTMAPALTVTYLAATPDEDSTTGDVSYLAEAALAEASTPLQTGQQVQVILPAPPLRPLARLFAPLTVNFAPSPDS